MIDILEIQNFQGHKDSVLQFHKGINVITGNSYIGKTSIIRAMKWLINNKPLSNMMKSRWGGDTVVTMYTSSIIDKKQNKIERYKNDNENGYVINGNIYNAIGAEIPKQVSDVLNMSDINIQYQLDSPFMLSSSKGEMSRFLNKIVNLEKIDSSLSNAEQEKRKISREIEADKLQLEKLEIQKMRYSFIEEMETDLAELDSYVKIICEYSDIRKRLFSIIKNYNTITRELENNKYKLDYKDISQLEILNNNLKEIKNRKEKTKEIVQKYESITSLVKDYRDKKIDLENKFNELMPNICPLCGGILDKEKNFLLL